jgi:hypothetical protein
LVQLRGMCYQITVKMMAQTKTHNKKINKDT